MLDTDHFEASGVERPGAGGAARHALRGQGEYVSDMQSEEDSSHPMEKHEECAQFHTSPASSRHLASLLDLHDNH
eukprot:5542711-Pyramimonas_sp.AAC.1